MKIKKIAIIVGVVAVVAAAGGAYWLLRDSGDSGKSSENTVYVDSVATICGLGSGNGLNDRFSGVVEPQKTLKIELPSDKKVDEVYVKVGDEVEVGDKLFSYNLEEMEESLAQAQIRMDQLANEIELAKKDIENVKKEKAQASADAQLKYTISISTLENSIKKKEYEQKTKQVEINKLEAGIKDTDVKSEMKGIIQTINKAAMGDDDSESYSFNGSESEAFMTILATGDYRVKGIVNEQNRSSIIEGFPVIIRSRVDDTTWTGTLTGVDTDNPEKQDNDYYGSSDSGMQNSSNYPFYVEMESVDGLMLGQHVFIEMDYGQTEQKEGLWLDAYYIVQEDDKAYVWAATSKDKIEKRSITLGEFDEDLQKYQIVDGLTEEDYITFPDDEVSEGDKVEKNTDQIGSLGEGIDLGGENIDMNMEMGGFEEDGENSLEDGFEEGDMVPDDEGDEE